jgi:hypothetical protein
MWIAIVAAAGMIVLGIAALIGSDSEPVDVSAQARPDAAVEPLGSDQHLQNQAALTAANGVTPSASDRHLLNQAARGANTATLDPSDQHLQNQAAKPVPDAG